MEDRQGKRTSKASIIKGLNATVQPINIQMDNQLVIGGTENYHQETSCNSPTMLDRYAEKLDRSTPIVKYFRSRSPVVGKLPSVGDTFSTPVPNVINANYRSAIINHYASSTSGSGSFGSWGGGSSLSPLSSIENLETPPARSPQIYGTPVKVDEEVIVMDGILISSVPAGAKTSRSGSDSGSGGGSSLGKNQHKTDICRSWEDSGSCRYGHKCQFAHGQEELRPTRLAVKTKSKFGESYGPKFRNNHALLGVAVTTSPSNLIDIINKTDQLARKEVPMASTPHTTTSTLIRHMNSKPTPISTISIVDWSPEDDGIEVVLPNSGIGGTSKREDANRETSKREGMKKKETSKREDVKKKETSKREDVNKHIHGVLYGSTERPTKKRLPVFGELTSEKPQKE